LYGKESKQKEVAQLAHKGYKWETIQAEINKCYMLCAPCHRKIHAGLLEIIWKVNPIGDGTALEKR
jgi:hypothetical protein